MKKKLIRKFMSNNTKNLVAKSHPGLSHAVKIFQHQSFLCRILQWLDILDPTTLLASDKEIKNAQTLLQNSQPSLEEQVKDEKIKGALKLTLLLFQSYSAGYNLANGNKTAGKGEKIPLSEVLLLIGAVSYTMCLGVFPQFMVYRYGLNSQAMRSLFTKVLPVPVLAIASAVNVAVVRGSEFEKGIELTDKNGNVVGVSQAAGTKAVKDTAVSRAVLIGTTVAVPNMIVSYLQRTNFIRKFPIALASSRLVMTSLILGLMIPVSFSLYPQMGKINRSKLEPSIQLSTTEDELHYNRGL
ncbi:sideroflexin-4 isoform X5 [Hypanus sabinus]|uniref:sideroflexin-4 isoform X5 n=1 Tax=Hypanus sabinus TaxID=79690 RepID=UPI0028C3C97E|nr:sideroflexin-4 isoform X5 [Hypanus sabinus]